MYRLPVIFGLFLLLAACRTTRSKSDLSGIPSVNGEKVSQKSDFPQNLCDKGGLQNTSQGKGWPFDARMGCTLNCGSEDALKLDFLSQLRSHRIYGDLKTIAEQDPVAGAQAAYYRQRQAKLHLDSGRFASMTKEQLFDGHKWKSMQDPIMPGTYFSIWPLAVRIEREPFTQSAALSTRPWSST